MLREQQPASMHDLKYVSHSTSLPAKIAAIKALECRANCYNEESRRPSIWRSARESNRIARPLKPPTKISARLTVMATPPPSPSIAIKSFVRVIRSDGWRGKAHNLGWGWGTREGTGGKEGMVKRIRDCMEWILSAMALMTPVDAICGRRCHHNNLLASR